MKYDENKYDQIMHIKIISDMRMMHRTGFGKLYNLLLSRYCLGIVLVLGSSQEQLPQRIKFAFQSSLIKKNIVIHSGSPKVKTTKTKTYKCML